MMEEGRGCTRVRRQAHRLPPCRTDRVSNDTLIPRFYPPPQAIVIVRVRHNKVTLCRVSADEERPCCRRALRSSRTIGIVIRWPGTPRACWDLDGGRRNLGSARVFRVLALSRRDRPYCKRWSFGGSRDQATGRLARDQHLTGADASLYCAHRTPACAVSPSTLPVKRQPTKTCPLSMLTGSAVHHLVES